MPQYTTVSYWDETMGVYKGFIVDWDTPLGAYDYWINYGDSIFIYVAKTVNVKFN